MYGDDGMSTTTSENAGGKLWEAAEKSAKSTKEDATKVSYEKSEVVVFDLVPQLGRKKWIIIGGEGTMDEGEHQWAQYIGFYIEFKSFMKHLEMSAGKMQKQGIMEAKPIYNTNSKVGLKSRLEGGFWAKPHQRWKEAEWRTYHDAEDFVDVVWNVGSEK